MALMVVRVRRVDAGMAATKRARVAREGRAAGGRWTWICVTKGAVVYATKAKGRMPHSATEVRQQQRTLFGVRFVFLLFPNNADRIRSLPSLFARKRKGAEDERARSRAGLRAKRTSGGLAPGLVRLDVARDGDEAEEGADEEARELEHGEEGGAPGAGVVDDEALRDLCVALPLGLFFNSCRLGTWGGLPSWALSHHAGMKTYRIALGSGPPRGLASVAQAQIPCRGSSRPWVAAARRGIGAVAGGAAGGVAAVVGVRGLRV